jgi:hypothetical protein
MVFLSEREEPGIVRNLLLILIAFIAVVTFIRAFDRAEAADFNKNPRVYPAQLSREIVEFPADN